MNTFQYPSHRIKLYNSASLLWTAENTQGQHSGTADARKAVISFPPTQVLQAQLVSTLVSWYFEPSQPQRVTSWLKTKFNLTPIYSARKSSNHKLSINHKISHDTNLHKTKLTQTSDTNFRRISPFGINPVEKAHKAGTRWYRGPLRRFINTRF